MKYYLGIKKEAVERNEPQNYHAKKKKPDLKKYTLYACIRKNTLEKTNMYYDTSRTVVALHKDGGGDQLGWSTRTFLERRKCFISIVMVIPKMCLYIHIYICLSNINNLYLLIN